MGLVSNLVGWAAVAAVLVGLAAVLAVASGYLLIGDPAAAASQVASGDVTAPNVTVENATFTGGGGDIGPSGIDTTVVMSFDVVVNNSMNAVGGSADTVDYDIAVDDAPDGPFQKIGDGVMRGVRVPPGRRTAQESSVELNAVAMAEAMGGNFDPRGTYVQVSGTATFAFGPFRFEVPFEEVRRMEIEDAAR